MIRKHRRNLKVNLYGLYPCGSGFWGLSKSSNLLENLIVNCLLGYSTNLLNQYKLNFLNFKIIKSKKLE